MSIAKELERQILKPEPEEKKEEENKKEEEIKKEENMDNNAKYRDSNAIDIISLKPKVLGVLSSIINNIIP